MKCNELVVLSQYWLAVWNQALAVMSVRVLSSPKMKEYIIHRTEPLIKMGVGTLLLTCFIGTRIDFVDQCYWCKISENSSNSWSKFAGKKQFGFVWEFTLSRRFGGVHSFDSKHPNICACMYTCKYNIHIYIHISIFICMNMYIWHWHLHVWMKYCICIHHGQSTWCTFQKVVYFELDEVTLAILDIK